MAESKPKGQPTLQGVATPRFSLSGWWRAIRLLDTIANSRGENGISITKSEAGWVFSQKKTQNDTTTAMVYTGEFDQLEIDTYTPGDVTRVSPANDAASTNGGPTVPGVYVCVAQPGADDFPRHPLQDGGETAFWNWLSTWPSETEDCVDGTPTTTLTDSQIKPASE
jgi:hypothetical protein